MKKNEHESPLTPTAQMHLTDITLYERNPTDRDPTIYGPISTGVQKQMTVGVRAVMTSGTDGLFGRSMGASGTSEVFHTLILVVFT